MIGARCTLGTYGVQPSDVTRPLRLQPLHRVFLKLFYIYNTNLTLQAKNKRIKICFADNVSSVICTFHCCSRKSFENSQKTLIKIRTTRSLLALIPRISSPHYSLLHVPSILRNSVR